MSLPEFFLLAFAASWLVVTLVLLSGWTRMPVFRPAERKPSLPLTVIIPVRNEEEGLPDLLADLDRQTYRHFEVIVADDQSTDRTPDLVRDYAARATYPLTLLRLTDDPGTSPKKRAISQAIRRAAHDWIVTTDGDCRVGEHWLETLAGYQEQTGAALVAGPVTFLDRGTPTDRLQIVEFASLVGTAMVSLFLGNPNMCNGANFSYSRKAFEAVNGFTGNENLASGDDEFLLHKIAAQFPVAFVKSREALVKTGAHASLWSFYQQRRRWASKWKHYNDWKIPALAIYVFCVHAALLLGIAGWVYGGIPGSVLLASLGLKWLGEWAFIGSVLAFFGQRKSIPWIGAVQVLYPFYVCFFGLAAQGSGYSWKGRKLR
jgi:cellulose synthase/poly-beta-1,6-N-acetylglucosamine synthase-like glycosyltransferase